MRCDFWPRSVATAATHRVFGALPDGTRQALASQAQVQAFQPGDIVLAESEMPGRLGWLLAGSVALADPIACDCAIGLVRFKSDR